MISSIQNPPLHYILLCLLIISEWLVKIKVINVKTLCIIKLQNLHCFIFLFNSIESDFSEIWRGGYKEKGKYPPYLRDEDSKEVKGTSILKITNSPLYLSYLFIYLFSH